MLKNAEKYDKKRLYDAGHPGNGGILLKISCSIGKMLVNL